MFLDHFEIGLDRCRVCEKRDAQVSESSGRTGRGFGLRFKWWWKGDADG